MILKTALVTFGWFATATTAGWQVDGDFATNGAVFVDQTGSSAVVSVNHRTIEANRVELKEGGVLEIFEVGHVRDME